MSKSDFGEAERRQGNELDAFLETVSVLVDMALIHGIHGIHRMSQ